MELLPIAVSGETVQEILACILASDCFDDQVVRGLANSRQYPAAARHLQRAAAGQANSKLIQAMWRGGGSYLVFRVACAFGIKIAGREGAVATDLEALGTTKGRLALIAAGAMNVHWPLASRRERAAVALRVLVGTMRAKADAR